MNQKPRAAAAPAPEHEDPEAPYGRRVRTGEPRKGPETGGAPTILSDAIVQQLVDVLIIGSTAKTACALAGITEDTFYRWAKRGARDRRKGRRTRYAKFSESVQKAFATAVAGYESVVAEAAKGSPELKRDGKVIRPAMAPNWQAAMTWLERRQPRDYARRSFRIEEEGVAAPTASIVGAVIPYAVHLPQVDPDPGKLALPHPEAARENLEDLDVSSVRSTIPTPSPEGM